MPSSKQHQKAKSAKQQQKAKSGGMSPTKTSDKEELLQARAVKRAERAEARRVHAEQHKETVCLLTYFLRAAYTVQSATK